MLIEVFVDTALLHSGKVFHVRHLNENQAKAFRHHLLQIL